MIWARSDQTLFVAPSSGGLYAPMLCLGSCPYNAKLDFRCSGLLQGHAGLMLSAIYLTGLELEATYGIACRKYMAIIIKGAAEGTIDCARANCLDGFTIFYF